jgi:hypothetical protein
MSLKFHFELHFAFCPQRPLLEKSHGNMIHAFIISTVELILVILFHFRLTTNSTYNQVFKTYPILKSANASI